MVAYGHRAVLTRTAEAAILRRKQLIALALRRVRPGSGSAREFLLARTWEGLPPVAIDLSQFAAPYVVIGAVATALYMPQRFTDHLDLLTSPNYAPALYRELEALRCRRTGTSRIGGTSWEVRDSGRLVVLESGEPWVRDALARPNHAPDGSPVITLPYLVLIKLAASRAVDVGDLSRMLGQADDTALAGVRTIVDRYRPEDREDLESLITLGRLELEDGGA